MPKAERVSQAWAAAYDEIGAAYPPDGQPIFEQLKSWAPGLANRISTAEREAEEASVRWVNGGPGGVQAAINIWRDVWLEAIKAIHNGSN